MHGPGVIQATVVVVLPARHFVSFFQNNNCLHFISPNLLTYPCTSGLYLMKKGKYDKNPAIVFAKK